MPKENINYPQVREYTTGGTDEPTVTNLAAPGPEFTVHWSANEVGWVQVGVRLDIATAEDYIKQVRADSPTDATVMFYSDILTRPDLQRSIRALRRARDSVYGADE